MYTKLETKKGEEILFLTQQYQVGLYCIINNDPSKQICLDVPENKFHSDVRKKAIKQGDTLLNGSIVEVKGKSKFDINKFQES